MADEYSKSTIGTQQEKTRYYNKISAYYFSNRQHIINQNSIYIKLFFYQIYAQLDNYHLQYRCSEGIKKVLFDPHDASGLEIHNSLTIVRGYAIWIMTFLTS
jgi:hypothetical protein